MSSSLIDKSFNLHEVDFSKLGYKSKLMKLEFKPNQARVIWNIDF